MIEENPPLYCKIIRVLQTDIGEGVIVFSKDKENTMKVSLDILREWEGKDVIIIINKLERSNK